MPNGVAGGALRTRGSAGSMPKRGSAKVGFGSCATPCAGAVNTARSMAPAQSLPCAGLDRRTGCTNAMSCSLKDHAGAEREHVAVQWLGGVVVREVRVEVTRVHELHAVLALPVGVQGQSQ